MRKYSWCLIGITIILYLTSFNSIADNLSDAKVKKNEIDSRINEIQDDKKKQRELLKNVLESQKQLSDSKNKLDGQKNKLVNKANNEEEKLEVIEDTIEQAEKNYEISREQFKKRVRSMYINSNQTALDILINSNNLVEMSGKYFILKNIARKDKEIIQAYKAAKSDLEFKKNIKEMEITNLKSQIESTNKQINKVNVNKTNLDQELNGINDRLKKLEMEEDRMLAESANMAVRIRNIQRSGRKYTGGSMMWPCPSCTEITSSFGMRYHPVLKKQRMHMGIDIGAAYGASVIAANNGIVIVADFEGGYGNAVIIDHGGGLTTLYGHNSALLVRKGQSVKKGEVIAKVGSTGISTGPHLHFEVRKDGEPQNPLNYVGN